MFVCLSVMMAGVCLFVMMAGVVFKKSLLVLPVYRHLATTVGPQPHFLIIIIIPEFNFYFNQDEHDGGLQ